MSFKIGMVSLGCPKNLVDSENMLGILKNEGYEITNTPEKADAIIVNTCGFIGDAKQESINMLIEMGGYKTSGKCKALIATGCLAERYSKEIKEELPEVDAIIGTGNFPEINKVIKEALLGEKVVEIGDIDRKFSDHMPRLLTTPNYTAYVKISDGCDKSCTYCIIPKLRGKYRSRSIDSIVEEVNNLAKNGVKEIILIAQDTSYYGIDLYGEYKLAELLNRLQTVEGIKWIRFLYCYPENINDELIQAIKNNSKVCKYIDMPIQHASDSILKSMARKSRKQEIINLINKIRKEIPDVIIRTSLIVGFPGETEDDFEQLREFVEQMKLNRLGVFMYSQEEDTPAANFDKQIDDNIKLQRYNIIMGLQKEISYNNNNKLLNKIFDILIVGQNDGKYYGRTYMDAPEIDGYVYFNSKMQIKSGDFVQIKVIQAGHYDIIGDVVK